jgi:hypothetical protein
LRRRTMYHERYVATKQMRVVVKVWWCPFSHKKQSDLGCI